MKNIAQINLYDTSQTNLKGFGALGLETTTATDAPKTFASFLSSAIGLITIIGIIWMVIIIITGSLSIITSGGDKNSLESAKKKISNGIIGLVMLVSSLFILSLVGKILGIPTILDIADLISKL